MSRLFVPSFLLIYVFLWGCAAPIEVTIEPTATKESFAALPSPTSLSPTVLPTKPPTLEPTAVSPTKTPVPPTETPKLATIEVVVEGDCLALERPFIYTRNEAIHQFESLITGGTCALETAVANGSFEVNLVEPSIGLYATLLSDTQADLIRVDFDGTIHNLNVPVGPFWAGRLHMTTNEQFMVWGDGTFNPDNEDEFIAQLMMADVNGRNPQIIYEHVTNLPEKLLPEIFFPIGFRPNGDVLFSIEPAGRGGGWFYTGDHTNLYQTAPDSAEKTEDDLVFDCPDSPFCIGDFTNDYSHFVGADLRSQTIFIVDIETREEVWRSVEDRSFVGRPKFNTDKDLAYVAVNVVDDGNTLRPENGTINLLDFPYDGEVVQLEAELASDLRVWIDSETILYYELTSNSGGEWRFPIINRQGVEVGEWESEQRFSTVVR